jgi:hypothetical protein
MERRRIINRNPLFEEISLFTGNDEAWPLPVAVEHV